MKASKLSIAFVLFTAIFFSCKSGFTKVNDVKKSLVMPGVPQGQTYINYTAEIELTASAVLKGAVLQIDDKSMPLIDYSIIDLTTGVIMKKDVVLPAGKYFFSARLIKQQDIDKTNDVLKLRFKTSKLETIAKKVTLGQTEFRK